MTRYAGMLIRYPEKNKIISNFPTTLRRFLTISTGRSLGGYTQSVSGQCASPKPLDLKNSREMRLRVPQMAQIVHLPLLQTYYDRLDYELLENGQILPQALFRLLPSFYLPHCCFFFSLQALTTFFV